MDNKRGQTSFFLFFIILFLFLSVIFLFVLGMFYVKINDALNQNIDLGQVNLQTLNSQTFGMATTMYLNNADWWGLSIIFGMIFGFLISSYFLRNTYPKVTIILDIFIIITAFIISLYISSTYQILLDSLQAMGEDFLEVYTPKTSMFLLNLPVFVVIIGVLLMVLFHSSIPRKSEESYQQGGTLQGI